MNNRFGIFHGSLIRNWKVTAEEVFTAIKKCAAVGGNSMSFFAGMVLQDWPIKTQEEFESLTKDLDMQVILINNTDSGNYKIYSESPVERQKGIDAAIKNIQLAGKKGYKLMDGSYLGPWPDVPDTFIDDKTPYFERAAEALKVICAAALDYDITLCQETFNRFENWLLNTAEEGIRLAQLVDMPNLKITFDTYHANIEEDDIAQGILSLGKKYLGNVHLGQNNRKLPGVGTSIDWDKVFSALAEIEFDGTFVFEPFVFSGGTVSQNVFLWRDLSGGVTFDEFIDQYGKSIQFVKNSYAKYREA